MKKTFLTLIISFIGYLNLQSQNNETFDLEVEITGMTCNTGKVYLALYDKEDSFLIDDADTIKTNTLVSNHKAIVKFKGIKRGEYAISLYHDENDNKKLDTKIFGIPKEPYGFSNNAAGFMGPPKFKDAKFNIDNDKSISIKLK